MDEPLGYSVPDACRKLGNCSRAHIYRLVNRDELELFKVGSKSLISTRSLNALLPEQREAA